MRESEIEKKLRVAVEKRGGVAFKFISSVAGVPDRIVVVGGEVFFVELKAPGERPRKLQWAMIRKLRRAGARVCIIDSIEDIETIL